MKIQHKSSFPSPDLGIYLQKSPTDLGRAKTNN